MWLKSSFFRVKQATCYIIKIFYVGRKELTPVVEDVAKAAKDFFPNFEIAKINNHLRLTKNVSDEVQRLAKKTNPGVPNNVLMSSSTLPSNIAEGHPLVNIGQYSRQTLKECLSLCQGLKTMIVVDTDLASKYKELQQSVLKSLEVSYDVQGIHGNLIFIGNFHLLKKYIESFGKKVIFLTDDREFRSTETEAETCQWVCEQTDYVLVTTPPYIKGFECEAIIDFTSMQEPDVLSRATIRIIKASGVMNEFIELDDEFFLTKMIGM